MSVVVPQPAMRKYVAIVVVKLPELENMAIEPLRKRLLGTVATECAADAHAVPGVSHAKTVAAEDVDAVGLPHGADLARVAHGELLGDDEDLFQVRVDTDELGHAVACRRRGQIDHATVEAVPRSKAFKYVVEDRHRPKLGLQYLAPLARRGAEYDVASGILDVQLA